MSVNNYARLVSLTFQEANIFGRLLRIRHELPNNPFERIMDAALDALSEEWGIEL